jgi:homoserine O-acetyltransferase/O-succinyltransferase
VKTCTAASLFCWFALVAAGQSLQVASIGDLHLQNGQSIRDCKIAYRTFGKMNAAHSNAILFPTWFSGTTKDLVDKVGPGKLVDSTNYFVITVDALGDGLSSAPSNSTLQPRMRFPEFSIRDMVESQHILLTRILHIQHLRAVMGISMGGMQTFQWITAYPDFMDLAIPIVGSPRLTSYDLLLWTSEAHAIQDSPTWQKGDYTGVPQCMRVVADIHALAGQTPDYWLAQTPPQAFAGTLQTTEKNGMGGFDCNNWLRQLQAMIGDDVFQPFGENPKKAAAAVKAKVLVVASLQDHMVNPHPGLEFAKLLHARTLELNSACGHGATGCDAARIETAVAEFLK